MSWDPIGHDPPYKRIDLNPKREITKAPAKSWMEEQDEIYEAAAKKREADRVWDLVKRYSSGNSGETDG